MPATDSFEVIPAIDVQDGEVVQLVGGERGTEQRYGDPEAAARRWVAEGARRLHLVDLDGAFEGERVNADAIDAILDTVQIPVQLGGGIRSVSEAANLLDRGIDRVILGTAAIERPEIVSDLSADYPGRVVVSLDASAGEVVIAGWTEGTGVSPTDAAVGFERRGAGAILFTDVDVEGQLDGVRQELIAGVAGAVSIPVIASGGVATIGDIRTIERAGAQAVVVGTALYEGAFTLREAIESL